MSSTKSLVKFRLKFIFIMILCSLTFFLSVYIGGAGAPKQANFYSKFIANADETIGRFCERFNYSNNSFSNYLPIAEIPETKSGYIPQGFCYCEKLNVYFISYYHSEKSSILALIDAETNKRIKTINLLDENGKSFTGHVGGIGDDGTYLYITCNKSVSRVEIEKIVNLGDYHNIILNEFIYTDVNCSYLNCDGKYLYVGEFYTNDGDYNTDESHHIMMSPLEVSFARVNAYKISSLEFNKSNKDISIPEFSLAVPNRVQGISRLGDGKFVLSVSYGRKNYSYLHTYKDVVSAESTYSYMVNDKIVPIYFLCENAQIDKKTLPPMLEGIDIKNNNVYGIFESGAEKYSDARFIENSICEF